MSKSILKKLAASICALGSLGVSAKAADEPVSSSAAGVDTGDMKANNVAKGADSSEEIVEEESVNVEFKSMSKWNDGIYRMSAWSEVMYKDWIATVAKVFGEGEMKSPYVEVIVDYGFSTFYRVAKSGLGWSKGMRDVEGRDRFLNRAYALYKSYKALPGWVDSFVAAQSKVSYSRFFLISRGFDSTLKEFVAKAEKMCCYGCTKRLLDAIDVVYSKKLKELDEWYLNYEVANGRNKKENVKGLDSFVAWKKAYDDLSKRINAGDVQEDNGEMKDVDLQDDGVDVNGGSKSGKEGLNSNSRGVNDEDGVNGDADVAGGDTMDSGDDADEEDEDKDDDDSGDEEEDEGDSDIEADGSVERNDNESDVIGGDVVNNEDDVNEEDKDDGDSDDEEEDEGDSDIEADGSVERNDNESDVTGGDVVNNEDDVNEEDKDDDDSDGKEEDEGDSDIEADSSVERNNNEVDDVTGGDIVSNEDDVDEEDKDDDDSDGKEEDEENDATGGMVGSAVDDNSIGGEKSEKDSGVDKVNGSDNESGSNGKSDKDNDNEEGDDENVEKS